MGLWSSIFRIRSIENKENCEIKLLCDGREVSLHNAVEIHEEFVLGKNIYPIHHWFVRYAEEVWKIEANGDIIDDSWSDRLTVELEGLVRLREVIAKVITEPELGAKLLPYPADYLPVIGDDVERDYTDPVFYDERYIEMLRLVGEKLDVIIAEHDGVECWDNYEYYAA